jgi:hypothetical protein
MVTRASAIALVQGVYFATTGVWPLLSIRTFEAVTGPKVDRWLVKTVGVLIGVIGSVLIAAGRRRRVTGELVALGAGSAAGLAAIDVVYAARGRIRRVYLLDAALEALLLAAWAVATRPTRSRRSVRSVRALSIAKPLQSLLK